MHKSDPVAELSSPNLHTHRLAHTKSNPGPRANSALVTLNLKILKHIYTKIFVIVNERLRRLSAERLHQQICGGNRKSFIVDVCVKFNDPNGRAERGFQGAAIGVERFWRVERCADFIDGGDALQRNEYGHRA